MSTKSVSEKRKSRDQFEFGVSLILVGIGFLVYQYKLIDIAWHWWQIWAIVATIFGALKIIRGDSAVERISGVFQILLGLTIYAMFEHMWGLNFWVHWPLLLIGLGLSHLLKYAFDPSGSHSDCK